MPFLSEKVPWLPPAGCHGHVVQRMEEVLQRTGASTWLTAPGSWLSGGEAKLSTSPFRTANTGELPKAPILLTPLAMDQGCCHLAGASAFQTTWSFPSANGIQHKNTALTNGVQPCWPPRLRAPVKSISNTSCLQSSLRALAPKMLRALGFWREVPMPGPISS